VLVAEIDIDAVKASRGKIPNLKNARDFKLERVGLKAGGVAA
jgi:deaminated glutathione amidase